MPAKTATPNIIDFWVKFSPWFHIGAVIFTAGVAWAGLSSQGTKIEKLELKQVSLGDAFADMKTTNARIEQKVDDIKDALNIKHREPK